MLPLLPLSIKNVLDKAKAPDWVVEVGGRRKIQLRHKEGSVPQRARPLAMRPPKGELARRAARVLQILRQRSGVVDVALVVLTNPRRRMSHDMDYPFRPSSSMRYLAQCDAPDTVLVVYGTAPPRLAYLDRSGPLDGGSINKSADLTALDDIHDRDGFRRLFGYRALLEHLQALLAHGVCPFVARDEAVWGATAAVASSAVDPAAPSTLLERSEDLMRVLHAHHNPFDAHAARQMATDALRKARLVKSAYELECLDRAAYAANVALDLIDARVDAAARDREGAGAASEQDLERMLKASFLLYGCTANSFPPIVALGAHAGVLHHRPTATLTLAAARPPQLVIDVGPSYSGYASDFTRAWWLGAPGALERQSLAYRRVHGMLSTVLRDMIAACRVGARVGEIVAHFERATFALVGEIPETIKPYLWREWLHTLTPHGIVHWIGLDVHDPHPETDHPSLEATELCAGMCLALEPAYYFPAEGTLAPRTQAMRGLCIRVEASIAVQAEGPPRVLGTPKAGPPLYEWLDFSGHCVGRTL